MLGPGTWDLGPMWTTGLKVNCPKTCMLVVVWTKARGDPAARATSHTRLSTRTHYTSSTLIGGKGGAGPSSLHSIYAWGTNKVCECKMDVKCTWIPTWHQIDHVSWSLDCFQKPSLEGRPTQNQETMALWMLTTIEFFYFIMCEDPHE